MTHSKITNKMKAEILRRFQEGDNIKTISKAYSVSVPDIARFLLKALSDLDASSKEAKDIQDSLTLARSRLSEEKVAQIIELWRKTRKSANAIAEELGTHPTTVRKTLENELGDEYENDPTTLSYRESRKPVPADLRKVIEERLQQGQSKKSIARELGVAGTSVVRVARKLGLPIAPPTFSREQIIAALAKAKERRALSDNFLAELKQFILSIRDHLHILDTSLRHVLLCQSRGFAGITTPPTDADKRLLEKITGGKIPKEILLKYVDEPGIVGLKALSKEAPEAPTASSPTTPPEDPFILPLPSEPVEGEDIGEPSQGPQDPFTGRSGAFPGAGPTEPTEAEEFTFPQFTVKSVMGFTEALRPTDDLEAKETIICNLQAKLWDAYFDSPEKAAELMREYRPESPLAEEMKDRFLSTMHELETLEASLPEDYIFPHHPYKEQLLVALEANKKRKLLNLLKMGGGKTVGAILSAMCNDSKRVVYVAPINLLRSSETADEAEVDESAVNEAVGQIAREFYATWRGVEVKCRERNPVWSNPDGPCVLVLSYHDLSSFGDTQDQEFYDFVTGFEPDTVIFDEIQYVKERSNSKYLYKRGDAGYQKSIRRRRAEQLVYMTLKENPNAMIMGMSGTLLTNELYEAVKLIELVTGEERSDLATSMSLDNAVNIHKEMTRISIRRRNTKATDWDQVKRIKIDAEAYLQDIVNAVNTPNPSALTYELALTPAKLPTLVKLCREEKTIVMVKHVTDIVQMVREALERARLRVSIYTGEMKLPTYIGHGLPNALEEFKAGHTDVLIASDECLSTGHDGLQDVCSQMVYLHLPWTASDFDQGRARIDRPRQRKRPKFIVLETYVPHTCLKTGEPKLWSYCNYRWRLIENKKILRDAVIDGILPEEDTRLTDKQCQNYIKGWLARLDEDTIIRRYGRPIRVPMMFATPNEELKARRKYGDFSKMNARWGRESSATLHTRLLGNPQEWEMYHTLFDEHRRGWDVDPLEEAIRFCAEGGRNWNIADFGCGTAGLADALRGRHNVISFDHISINANVIPVDIATGVPLASETVDVVISCLGLMGKNWEDQLPEAHRVLKAHLGQLLIWVPGGWSGNERLAAAVREAGFNILSDRLVGRWRHLHALCLPAAREEPLERRQRGTQRLQRGGQGST